MERRRDGQHDGALRALRRRKRDRALDRRLVAGDHDLGAAVVVRDVADLALRRIARDLGRGFGVEAEQRRHGADPDRGRVLHGIAANAQQPRRVGDREGAGGGKRRILAERVPGDEGGVAGKVEPGLGLEDADRSKAHRHEGRLGIRGQRQRVRRALEHQALRASATAPRRPRRGPRGPAERPRQAPCPCRPPGCPAPETRMPAPCHAAPSKRRTSQSRSGKSRRGRGTFHGPWKDFHGRVPTRFHDDGAAIHRRP